MLRRVTSKANDLATLIYPNTVPMMPTNRTAAVNFTDIIGFSPVPVPRFVLR
jgi:hypothetical protein